MVAKTVRTFVVFLVAVGLFGAGVALVNQCLRAHDMDSPWATGCLAGVMAVVYYRAWRWLCRRLDKIGRKDG